jgi:hypothetical protein
MPRLVYLLGVALALALAFTDWALTLQAGVTEANVRRIRVGMTRCEVTALVGHRPYVLIGNGERYVPEKWLYTGRRGSIEVTTGKDGRAESARWVSEDPQRAVLDRLRAWLGW